MRPRIRGLGPFSRLSAPSRRKAEAEADQLRHRLVDLQAMQALAQWLDGRPQLGREVFTRGCPEGFVTAIGVAHAADVVAFLWVSLAEAPAGERFERFLPDMPAEDADGGQTLSPNLHRLAWGSTFIASLELAKQGDLILAQEDLFTPIHVSPAPASPSA